MKRLMHSSLLTDVMSNYLFYIKYIKIDKNINAYYTLEDLKWDTHFKS